jgi:glycosyltransferase involved in cell wall biosynthesis
MGAEGFHPDVIDAEFFYPDGPAAAHLAKALGIPFSVKARGADIHYWAGRRACRRLILSAAEQANGLLAVSQSLKRDMVMLGIAPEKVTVHYTGVDLELFQPSDRAAAKAALGVTGKLVVSLGALIPRKGHDIVIEALATLADVNLLVVGEGPSRVALTRFVADRGLGQRVRFLGRIPHTRLPSILGAADVMALASKSEGLANAWVEAMACGTPVVAPAVDGAEEAICPPRGGRLIRERTVQAMATAIYEVLANPLDQQVVRAQARRFDWKLNTETLYAHLSGLADRATRSRG